MAVGFFDMGLGPFVGSAIAAGAPERRVASTASLKDRLRRAGVELVAAELGRTSSGPAWVLTVQTADQHVVTVNAGVPSNQDPHSVSTSDDIVKRVLQYLGERSR